MHTRNRYTGRKILKSPLKLIGAKTKIRDLLYQYFPFSYGDYFEPFMGTAGILIGQQHLVNRFEYTSDTSWYAINFFKQIQSYPEEFWNAYQTGLQYLKIGKKSEFLLLREVVTDSMACNLQKAVCFYLITKTCMNGIWRLNAKGECNSSYCGTVEGRGFMDRKWFDAIVSRIRSEERRVGKECRSRWSPYH